MEIILAARWDGLLELPAGLSVPMSGPWQIEAVLLSGVWEEQMTEGLCVLGVWVLQIHGSFVPHCQCGCENEGRRL